MPDSLIETLKIDKGQKFKICLDIENEQIILKPVNGEEQDNGKTEKLRS